jgi:lipopolysaccharide export LptBFGC system permease protein LptF
VFSVRPPKPSLSLSFSLFSRSLSPSLALPLLLSRAPSYHCSLARSLLQQQQQQQHNNNITHTQTHILSRRHRAQSLRMSSSTRSAPTRGRGRQLERDAAAEDVASKKPKNSSKKAWVTPKKSTKLAKKPRHTHTHTHAALSRALSLSLSLSLSPSLSLSLSIYLSLHTQQVYFLVVVVFLVVVIFLVVVVIGDQRTRSVMRQPPRISVRG